MTDVETGSEGPVASILHEEAIRRLADSRSFERGKGYFAEGRVKSLVRREGSIGAKVKGEREYDVRIWVHLGSLAYSCSCPQGQDRAFCKHAVALAFAWVAVGPAADPEVFAALDALPRADLVALLQEEALINPSLRARILGRRSS